MDEENNEVRNLRPFALAGLLSCLAGAHCGGKKGSTESSACRTCVDVDHGGFTPSSLVLDKGDPGSTTTVTFKRTTEDTCARWVAIPDLKRNVPLPLNKAVPISFPTDATRTLSFQCGTGMYKGSVVVR